MSDHLEAGPSQPYQDQTPNTTVTEIATEFENAPEKVKLSIKSEKQSLSFMCTGRPYRYTFCQAKQGDRHETIETVLLDDDCQTVFGLSAWIGFERRERTQ